MAFIRYLPPDDIPLEDRVPDQDNILRIHGAHSRTMRLHYELYRELMYSPGPLSRGQREMIAVVVSALNGCRYWIEHHGAGLRTLLRARGMQGTEAEELVGQLVNDYREAPLAPTDRAMLDYAVKLTQTPSAIAAADVEHLRSVGFDDRAIHDACAIAAYYAFVNRIADGLGVELEQRFPRWRSSLTAARSDRRPSRRRSSR